MLVIRILAASTLRLSCSNYYNLTAVNMRSFWVSNYTPSSFFTSSSAKQMRISLLSKDST
jgi:hypothetical protein